MPVHTTDDDEEERQQRVALACREVTRITSKSKKRRKRPHPKEASSRLVSPQQVIVSRHNTMYTAIHENC